MRPLIKKKMCHNCLGTERTRKAYPERVPVLHMGDFRRMYLACSQVWTHYWSRNRLFWCACHCLTTGSLPEMPNREIMSFISVANTSSLFRTKLPNSTSRQVNHVYMYCSIHICLLWIGFMFIIIFISRSIFKLYFSRIPFRNTMFHSNPIFISFFHIFETILNKDLRYMQVILQILPW